MAHERWFQFVWLPTFETSAKKLLDEEDRRAIESELCEDLEAGSLIKRTGGFRKLRYALEGSGKSGGARIIYFVDENCERVYMTLAYPKGAKETLTRAEENALRHVARELKDEDC